MTDLATPYAHLYQGAGISETRQMVAQAAIETGWCVWHLQSDPPATVRPSIGGTRQTFAGIANHGAAAGEALTVTIAGPVPVRITGNVTTGAPLYILGSTGLTATPTASNSLSLDTGGLATLGTAQEGVTFASATEELCLIDLRSGIFGEAYTAGGG